MAISVYVICLSNSLADILSRVLVRLKLAQHGRYGYARPVQAQFGKKAHQRLTSLHQALT